MSPNVCTTAVIKGPLTFLLFCRLSSRLVSFFALHDDSQITVPPLPPRPFFERLPSFNRLHDRRAPSAEVAGRQLGHTAAGLSTVRAPVQMINVPVCQRLGPHQCAIHHWPLCRQADRQGQCVLSLPGEENYGR